ncbi:MAG: hypothetical protein WA842_09710 [Croceibacterium sp.]
MAKIPIPNEFEQRLLADARKVIGEIDGVPIDNLDGAWRLLRSKIDKPEVAKLVLQKYESAMKADQAWRENAVADLLAYKAHWGPIFDLQRKSKRPLPKQYPDPDDIVISSPVSFTFVGPVTEKEARDWTFYHEARDAFFMVAKEIIDSSGEFVPVEKSRERWAKIRRQYYRINRRLPADFKKKHPATFPRFEPAC